MPREFVKNGLRYYADNESDNNKDNALISFNKRYEELKYYEKWKMKDPAHFFIKLNNKDGFNLKNRTLYNGKETEIESLLYDYKKLCDKRNDINHGKNGKDEKIDAKSLSDKIKNFIKKYEEIIKIPVSKDKIIEFKLENGEDGKNGENGKIVEIKKLS